MNITLPTRHAQKEKESPLDFLSFFLTKEREDPSSLKHKQETPPSCGGGDYLYFKLAIANPLGYLHTWVETYP